MNWRNVFCEIIGFDKNNNWALLAQLVTLAPIVFYTFKSSKVFFKESISEHNQQGAVPILAVIYSAISIVYCYIFIKNFGTIISLTHLKILNALNDFDNIFWYTFSIKLLTTIALIAFAFNFTKSLYTLNSLEFGLLNDKHLKHIFCNNKTNSVIEAIIRLSIAVIFIYIEKKLGTTDYIALQAVNSDATDFIENKFLLTLGYWISILYIILILWLFLLKNLFDKENKLNKTWYTLSYWQFICGLIVGLIFIFIGSSYIEDNKEILLIILIVGVTSSLALIFVILKNEIINYKNGKLRLTN